MAVRKVSHHTRIVSTKSIKLTDIQPGMIIRFKYDSDGNHDMRPLVFVLFRERDLKGTKGRGKTRKLQRSGTLDGINITYLSEYKVEKLLEESNFRKLTHYTLYKNAFRTYTVSKMKLLEEIEYKTEEQKRLDNQVDVEGKQNENKL